MCEEEFTEEQENAIWSVLDAKERKLLFLVRDAILECERTADIEFAENNIVFKEHSPANSEYLRYSLICELFAELHGGDKKAAAHAIRGMQGQSGLLDDNGCLIEEYVYKQNE